MARLKLERGELISSTFLVLISAPDTAVDVQESEDVLPIIPRMAERERCTEAYIVLQGEGQFTFTRYDLDLEHTEYSITEHASTWQEAWRSLQDRHAFDSFESVSQRKREKAIEEKLKAKKVWEAEWRRKQREKNEGQ